MSANINWNETKRPVVVDPQVAKSDGYIFKEQMGEIVKLYEATMAGPKLFSADEEPTNLVTDNKVISIVGERGSGESSLLYTASCYLEKEKNCYTIGPIDPTVFDDSLRVPELVLAEVYTIMQKKMEKHEQDQRFSSLFAQLSSQLSRAVNILSNIRISKEQYANNNTSPEILDDYHNRTQFKEIMRTVLQLTLEMINHCRESTKQPFQAMALCIDDIDMVENKRVFEMTEDIRKYLGETVVTLISYRETQLFYALLQEKMQENSLLVEKGLISIGEVQQQVSKYLEKFTPSTTKVYMPNEGQIQKASIKTVFQSLLGASAEANADDLFYQKMVVPFGFLDSNQIVTMRSLTVENWLYWALEARLRIDLRPVDVRENTVLSIPQNLRGILTLAELLVSKMKPVPQNEKKQEEQISCILENITIYQGYLMESSQFSLSEKQKAILATWNNSPAETKNYQLYLAFMNLVPIETLQKAWMDGQNVLNVNVVQPYNVALADIHKLLESYKEWDFLDDSSEKRYYFCYLVKALYSLVLLQSYLRALASKAAPTKSATGEDTVPLAEEALQEYLHLLNCYLIPDFVSEELKAQAPEARPMSMSFRFQKSRGLSSGNITAYGSLVNKVCSTLVSLKSDVRPAIRPFITQGESKKTQYTYRYRHAFDSGPVVKEKEGLTNDSSYPYDPFAFLGKRVYIENSFTALLERDNSQDEEKGNKQLYYVLLSLFDIDRIVRRRFAPSKFEDNPLGEFLERVNAMLVPPAAEDKGVLSRCPLRSSSGYDEVDTWGKYQPAFTEQEINEAKKFDERLFPKQDDALLVLRKDQAIELMDELLLDHKELFEKEQIQQMKEMADYLKIPRTQYGKDKQRRLRKIVEEQVRPQDKALYETIIQKQGDRE